MSEADVFKEGRNYFLKKLDSDNEKLFQIEPDTAKLIFNGYIIVTDNILEPNGFLLTVMGRLIYADNISHLKSLLSSTTRELSGYLPACEDVEENI